MFFPYHSTKLEHTRTVVTVVYCSTFFRGHGTLFGSILLIIITIIVNNINNYIYIYLHIGRMCLVAPMLLLIRMLSVCIQMNTNVIRGLVKRAQLLWQVHNFRETCTTAGKRAQHLSHVHNISDTCAKSLTRAHHLWNVHNISETCTYRILENTGWGRWNTLCP